MKKIIIGAVITMVALTFFAFYDEVMAWYGDSSTNIGTITGKCTWSRCWPSIPGADTRSAVRGMRLSLQTVDGNYYSGTGSSDILSNGSQAIKLADGSIEYYYWNERNGSGCTKVSYLTGSCDFDSMVFGNRSFPTADTVEAAFRSVGVNNFSSSFGNFNFNKIVNDLAGEATLENGWPFLKTLFGLSDYDVEYLSSNPDELMKLWIVFEPTSVITMNGKQYYGSAYELGTVRDDAGQLYGGSVVRNTIACASYVTGTIPGSALEDGFVVPGVTSDSYFNGTIKFVDDCEEPTHDEIQDNNGIGLGLLWVPDLFSPTDRELLLNGGDGTSGPYYNCDTMNEHYKTNHNLDLTKQPASFIDTFDFSDYNNKFKTEITNQWYKDTCINSCDAMNKYYLENKQIDLTQQTEDYINKFNFEDYNNQFGTGITNQWYVDNCINNTDGEVEPPPPPPVNCTPDYNLGDCLDGDDIYYSDVLEGGSATNEYWESCIFNDYGTYDIPVHKTSSDYFEKELSTDYCEVYCIEELTTNYPTGLRLVYNSDTLLAGTHFLLPSSSVSGSRTCSTKSIDWEEFESDLANENGEAIKAYLEWQVEIRKRDAINGASGSEDTSCSCTDRTPTETHYNEDGTFYTTGGECIGWEDGYDVSWYGMEQDGQKVPNGSASWCEGDEPSTNVQGKKEDYLDELKDPEYIESQMKGCYTWEENAVYKVDPTLTLEYDSGNYIDSIELDSSTNYGGVESGVIPLDSDVDLHVVRPGCNEPGCQSDEYSIDTNTNFVRYEQYTASRSATTKFTLPAGQWQYVNKDGAVSSNKIPDAGSKFTSNYIDIGYSNLPISFSSPSGMYGSMHGNGSYDFLYEQLGHVDEELKVSDILPAIGNNDNDDYNYGEWSCEFYVNNELFPEDPYNPGGTGGSGGSGGGTGDGGIWLIYRPIDLVEYPFPDMDATTRWTGYNWCYDNNCASDGSNPVVEHTILQNRGVEGDDLYYGENAEPMYTFYLTPEIITEIRRYNYENEYAEYTGTLNNVNYDYVCETGTGNTCISGYLTHLINLTGAKNEPGTCVADKTRMSNDPLSFEACRYPTGFVPIVEMQGYYSNGIGRFY